MATEVHHRTPISEGGSKYDWANLESVCGDCQDEAHGARPKIRIDPRTGLPSAWAGSSVEYEMTGGGGYLVGSHARRADTARRFRMQRRD